MGEDEMTIGRIIAVEEEEMTGTEGIGTKVGGQVPAMFGEATVIPLIRQHPRDEMERKRRKASEYRKANKSTS